MEIIKINGIVKDTTGKKVNRVLRREGITPCIMYGGKEPVAFTCTEPEFRHLIFTSKFKLAEITLNGSTHKCLVKAIQFHPLTDKVQHIDFLELVPGQKLKADIPLSYHGQAPGVKIGGKFLAKVRKVSVITTPEFLVAEIPASISKMELGGILRVRDIAPIEGVEITNAQAMPIAAIEIPRALRSAQAAAAAKK